MILKIKINVLKQYNKRQITYDRRVFKQTKSAILRIHKLQIKKSAFEFNETRMILVKTKENVY